jgi:hypothetical protein
VVRFCAGRGVPGETFECTSRVVTRVDRPREAADRTAAVAAAIRRLDARGFVEFCAALWAARGYETRVEGERIVATRDGRRVVVVADAAPGRVRRAVERVRAVFAWRPAATRVDGDVDVVAATAEGTAERLAARLDARPAGPRALADCLLYGCDRADADDLAARYLGGSTAALLAHTSSRVDDRDDGRDGRGGRGVATLASGVGDAGTVGDVAGVGVVAAACLVVVAVAVGLGVFAAGDGGGSGGAAALAGVVDAGGEDETDTAVPAGSAAGDGSERTDGGASATTYPPGVGADSLDVGRLADAHAASMDGRSYRLVVRHAGNTTVGGSRRWEGTSRHATVESDRVWRYTVSHYADGGDGGKRTGYSVYADGEFAYRRVGEGANASFDRDPVRATRGGGEPMAERVRGYLHRYLTTTVVRVHRPTRHADAYRVVATGQPTRLGREVTEYTAVASVAPDGRVSRLRVEYTSREGVEEETVRFQLEYTVVDGVTVRQPRWYDEAAAATAANATRD